MTLFIILFFISLLGITVLIGRRLLLIYNGTLSNNRIIGDFAFEVADLEDVKHLTTKKIKKYGYVLLVNTIKIYVKSGITIKKVYTRTTEKIYDINRKYFKKNESYDNIKPASSFLSTIGEYKKKIGRITKEIKEEHGLKTEKLKK